jgi:hypothetical protein
MNCSELFNLKNRVAVVLGGTAGIGMAIARAYAAAGAQVVAPSPESQCIDASESKTSGSSRSAFKIEADAQDRERVQAELEGTRHKDDLVLRVKRLTEAFRAGKYKRSDLAQWDKSRPTRSQARGSHNGAMHPSLLTEIGEAYRALCETFVATAQKTRPIYAFGILLLAIGIAIFHEIHSKHFILLLLVIALIALKIFLAHTGTTSVDLWLEHLFRQAPKKKRTFGSKWVSQGDWIGGWSHYNRVLMDSFCAAS